MKHFFILPKFLLLLTLVLTANNAFSQRAGQLDLGFNPADTVYLGGNYSRSGPSGEVKAIATQPDGKILIFGSFATYNEQKRSGIARLNPDGSLDTSVEFKPIISESSYISQTAFLPDGSTIIAGGYRTKNYKSFYFIARLLPDGSLDTSFTPITGLKDQISKITIQPNGKILVLSELEKVTFSGGHNSKSHVESRSKLWRVNKDGSIDLAFKVGITNEDVISSVALQPNGNIIIGGRFLGYKKSDFNYLVCLRPNGAINKRFKSGKGPDEEVYSIAIQPDGKILVTGMFHNFNGNPRKYLLRLHADGSLDKTYSPGRVINGVMKIFMIQPDGKSLIHGGGMNDGTIVRLNTDGTLDKSFSFGRLVNNNIEAMEIQADGKILIGGFVNCHSNRCQNLGRLNADGSWDRSFNRKTGVEGRVINLFYKPDGKILLEGVLRSYNGFPMASFGRILPNGLPDTLYKMPGAELNRFNTVALQPDGKLLFTARMMVDRNSMGLRLGRLNQDGSFDSTFTPRLIPNNYQLSLDKLRATAAVQPDGKILMALKYTKYYPDQPGYSGTSLFVRLHPDGTLDSTFRTKVFETGLIESLLIQPDGKILVTGWLFGREGEKVNSIARFNPDGSYDQSFNSSPGSNGKITTTVLHPDGKISVCGNFDKYQDFPRNKIARLLKNGSIDKSFDPGAGPDGEITSHTVQEDGKMIIVGKFKNYNGISRNGIARLNTNGSLDLSFDPGSGLEGYANKVLLQPDGKLIVGGYFRSYNGIPKNGLIRVHTK